MIPENVQLPIPDKSQVGQQKQVVKCYLYQFKYTKLLSFFFLNTTKNNRISQLNEKYLKLLNQGFIFAKRLLIYFYWFEGFLCKNFACREKRKKQ